MAHQFYSLEEGTATLAYEGTAFNPQDHSEDLDPGHETGGFPRPGDPYLADEDYDQPDEGGPSDNPYGKWRRAQEKPATNF